MNWRTRNTVLSSDKVSAWRRWFRAGILTIVHDVWVCKIGLGSGDGGDFGLYIIYQDEGYLQSFKMHILE